MINLSIKLPVRFALYEFYGERLNGMTSFTHTTVSGSTESIVALRLFWTGTVLTETPFGKGSLRGIIEAGEFTPKAPMPFHKIRV